ncbi:hypothetical protein GCM10020221_07420 [Streptomyces thioluteus]|uniref:Integral membrane protein n=1 Tax=Streptomyces thioluteus TaxID=66431 RepID=A0ABN3WH29_STRTU
MSTVPDQPTVPAHRTEATRLLCAGVYLDLDFRRRVIEELWEHRERPVAPSLGIDVAPVLGHALRARGQDAMTAFFLVVLWAGFAACDYAYVSTADPAGLPFGLDLPMVWCLMYAVVSMVYWLAQVGAGRGGSAYVVDNRTLQSGLTGHGSMRAVKVVGSCGLLSAYWELAIEAMADGAGNWPAVVFPLLLTVPVWFHRIWVASVMREELCWRAWIKDVPRIVPNRPALVEAIDREQCSQLLVYDASRPFIGMGQPGEPWFFALELKRRAGADAATAPLTAREVLELIRPHLRDLQGPDEAVTYDSLKGLDMTELVCVPPKWRRNEVPYDPVKVGQCLREALEGGGEWHRHFLWVRVGAWKQDVVVSVLVRVHTQGGMLVVEVAPHVLMPVRLEYRAVDAIGERGEGGLLGWIRALRTAHAAGFAAVVSTWRACSDGCRSWFAAAQRALPDSPAASVRELGSADRLSLFQEMDASRYIRTVQDRVVSGVRDALRSRGYETDEFEQQVVQLGAGSVYIGAMSGGAVAVGREARANARSQR